MSQTPQQGPRFSPELDPGALFEPAGREDWLALVAGVLKGADFDETLVSPGLDGIDLQPLYAAGDAPQASDREAALTGDRPTRGWTICQRYAHPDPAVVNRRIRQDLARGVEGVWLRLDRATRLGLSPDDPEWASTAGHDGILLSSAADLEILLEGVHLEMIHLAIEAGEAAPRIAAALLALARARGLDLGALRLAFDFDPLAQLATEGRLHGVEHPPGQAPRLAAAAMAELVREAASMAGPQRALAVSTLPYHAAGASPAQELAFAMASAAELLRAMAEQGRDAAAVCDGLRFAFGVDADFFGSVAKLRAARRLWCRLLRAIDGNVEQAGPMQIHALTSPRTLAGVDPWVNLLRGTHQAVAAVIGGADQLSVLPFDGALGLPDDFGRRLAASTQSILQLESNLHRVADPAGGSHYLEWRTDQLARVAWRKLQKIEADGGMLAGLVAGRVQAAVAESAVARRAEIAAGRRAVIGVSKYPPPEDLPRIEGASPDPRPLQEAARERERARIAATGAPAWPAGLAEGSARSLPPRPLRIEALRPMRDGDPQEAGDA